MRIQQMKTMSQKIMKIKRLEVRLKAKDTDISDKKDRIKEYENMVTTLHGVIDGIEKESTPARVKLLEEQLNLKKDEIALLSEQFEREKGIKKHLSQRLKGAEKNEGQALKRTEESKDYDVELISKNKTILNQL